MLGIGVSPVLAQQNVTFQIDLNPVITACQFDAGTDVVTMPGSFNGWNTASDTLTDADSDGVYSLTKSLADGTYNYKFFLSTLEWEDDPNREVVATTGSDTTLASTTYNKTFTDICGGTEVAYEIAFQVDMSVAVLGGRFDPDNDQVTVAGSFNGWNTTADTLLQDFANPNVWVKIVEQNIVVPNELKYKFVILKDGNTGWEGGNDRALALDGSEPNGQVATTDDQGNAPYFDRVDPSMILGEETTFTFEVDARPAFYYLADNGRLPNDTQTGDPVDAFATLFVNGPVASLSDKLSDWATWGPEDLGQIPSRQLVDDGTGGDAAADDSVYTIQFTYPAGTPTTAIGKFGTDGYDNEGGFGADHVFKLDPTTPTIRRSYGAIVNGDGFVIDDKGPTNEEGTPGDYDPYILISPDSTEAIVLREGGEADYDPAEWLKYNPIQRDYAITFSVDMSVAKLGGRFNDLEDVVVVAGSFNGWSTTTDTLLQDFQNPDLYTAVVEASLEAPQTINYKFVIGKAADSAPQGWESGDNRVLSVTGEESSPEITNLESGNAPYFDRVGPDMILTEDATFTFEVDARPAFYYLAENGRLPNDTQTGDPVDNFTALYVNGPLAGNADGLGDWATWGPNDLGAIPGRQLVDDGTGADAVAGDSVYTISLSFKAGTPNKLVGKFGTDGYDNEGGFGADHHFPLNPESPITRTVYGGIITASGLIDDSNGPTNPDGVGDWDKYILISPDSLEAIAVLDDQDKDGDAAHWSSLFPVFADYDILFSVDMSVAKLGGRFNDAEDIVVVAGSFNGWSTTTDTLLQDFQNPDLYTKLLTANVQVPSDINYKFVIGKAADSAPQGWESGDNRVLSVTGEESSPEITNLESGNAPYFDRVGPDMILTEDATFTFEVDARPAFYYLAENGRLPNDTQTGDPVDNFTALYVNGPLAGNADGLGDWATWGPNDLGAIPGRQLVDDGTGADAVAGDSVYTISLSFKAGTPNKLVGKFGTDGYDNEGGFGADHHFPLNPESPITRTVYGGIITASGLIDDSNGPTNPDGVGDWDKYILISPDSLMAMAVMDDGDLDGDPTAWDNATDTEAGFELPATTTLSANYPNPFNPSTRFEYALAETQHVRLSVFNLLGQEVAVLVDGVQPASTYQVSFDASELTTGTYLYRLQTSKTTITRTMTLVK